MIREQFLQDVTENNLFSLKLLRDTAFCLEVAAFCDRNQLLAADRILSDFRILLFNCVKFSYGFIQLTDDTRYHTAYTAAAERFCAFAAGLEFDERLYNAVQRLSEETKTEVGIRGSLFELQIRLCGEIVETGSRLRKLIAKLKAATGLLYRIPGYVMSALDEACAAVLDAALSNQNESFAPVRLQAETLKKLGGYVRKSVDPYENILLARRIELTADDAEAARLYLSKALDNEIRCDMIPVIADLTLRLALHRAEADK
ncbi:MAG: hypothetical protein LBH24_06750 [Clostridiales bacterium]|jgi:hypothetical protein|nr:hypothetical protein [Clostridiales bacterium]